MPVFAMVHVFPMRLSTQWWSTGIRHDNQERSTTRHARWSFENPVLRGWRGPRSALSVWLFPRIRPANSGSRIAVQSSSVQKFSIPGIASPHTQPVDTREVRGAGGQPESLDRKLSLRSALLKIPSVGGVARSAGVCLFPLSKTPLKSPWSCEKN